MKEGNKFYSIFNFKCPKCHKGDLYPTRLSEFKKVFTMYDHCPACGQPYVIEPGFYWGAMYIAYMISSAIILTGFAFLFFAFGFDIIPSFIIIVIFTGMLYGLIFRLARSVWINLFVHYDPNRPLKKQEPKPEKDH